MAYDIVVCGHLCLDLIPDMEKVTADNLTTAGKLFETGALQISTGGAVSNTGLALHRLGMSVSLISLVGDDLLGTLITNFLHSRDPQLSQEIQVVADVPSSYTVVLSPENQDRTFLHCTGPNDIFDSAFLDLDVIQEAKLFHLGYPPLLPRLLENGGQDLTYIFRKVHDELGLVTSLDMTLPNPDSIGGRAPWQTILERTLPHVDIFIPSLDEIMYMLRRDDYERWGTSQVTRDYLEDLAQDLLNMGVAIAGFKLGTAGIYLRTTTDEQRLGFLEKIGQLPDQWLNKTGWHPAFKVQVAGTTGAGDATYAGFLSAIFRGMDYEACMCWACAVGACTVEVHDATSGVLTWEETAQRLSSDWDTLPSFLV